jgi:hypothetical protein
MRDNQSKSLPDWRVVIFASIFLPAASAAKIPAILERFRFHHASPIRRHEKFIGLVVIR